VFNFVLVKRVILLQGKTKIVKTQQSPLTCSYYSKQNKVNE